MPQGQTPGWAQTPITGHLVDASNPRERLEMQYNPSEFVDEKEANYATIAIPGMSHPRYQFVSGMARKITFTLYLFKDPKLQDKVAWLQSCLYPEHQGTMLKQAPHRLLLFFGDLYNGTECILRACKVRYHSMFDPKTLKPLRADIELVFEEYVAASVNASTVRKRANNVTTGARR